MEWIEKRKIITIVRGIQTEYMPDLADALLAGGIDLMEVTFVQDRPETWADTVSAIRAICQHVGDRMLVGAGTVLTREQLMMAQDAGARYIITPNTNPDLIHEVKKQGLCSLPGAFTPTEIEAAYEAGADAVKVFPAGALGPSYLKALKAPLSHIPMMAVGGVNEKNAADFIAAGCCGVGVSSCLANRSLIEAGQLDEISSLAARLRKTIEL